MTKVEEAIAHNLSDVAENGPGLRYGRKTALAARCHTGKHALVTGLGALGVGSMWREALDEERSDQEWETLPVRFCSEFGIAQACERPAQSSDEEVGRFADAVIALSHRDAQEYSLPPFVLVVQMPDGSCKVAARNILGWHNTRLVLAAGLEDAQKRHGD